MFKFLKEKIGKWAKNVSSKTEDTKEKPKSKKVEVPPEKEVSLPMKFNVGTQKYEPDLETIKETEKTLEKPKDRERPEKESFLKKLGSKIQKIKISEKEFEIYSEELSMLLLENNVAFEVAEKIIEELKEEIVGKDLLKKEIESEVKEALSEIIKKILIEPFNLVEKIKEKKQDQSKEPYIILFVGVNGTGKTTTVAKISKYLSKNGFSSVLAAGDTFRAASIEQLKKHGENLGVNVISQQYGADSAAVGFDAIKYAKKNFIDCVLIDTAGRMHTSKNLMKEIEKISRVCKPDTKIFVGESITGNDSIEQAKSFDWAVGIDGIILSKADVDEKGGTALSLGYVTKKPILFLGTGQEYEEIEVFDKKKFLKELGL